MTDATYTRDGETEYELAYDLPEDEDDTVYLVPAGKPGAQATTVTLAEFREEWVEFDDTDKMDEWVDTRLRKGFGIN